MNTVQLLLRVGAVFALLMVVLWLVRRTGAGNLRRSGPMQVLGSTRLGKTSSLTLVRIGDQTYALGVTDRTVTLLTETPTVLAPDPSEAVTSTSAMTELRQLGERLVTGVRGLRPETPPSNDEPAAPARPQPPTTTEFLRQVAAKGAQAWTARRTTTAVATLEPTSPAPDAPTVITLPSQRLPEDAPSFDLILAGALGLSPVVDGSTTQPVTRAPRTRQHARTDAPSRRDEDDPWTTRCRQTRPPRARGSHVY